MKHLKELQNEYAHLVINEGLRIQKGQRLVINCPVEGAYFARLCAKAAYEAGCKDVLMRWTDDTMTKYHYLYAADEVFDEVNDWVTLMLDTVSAEGAAWLAIAAADPENLKDCDPERLHRAQISSGKARENFRKREQNNDFPWCVCSIPTAAWAKAVFPDLESGDAVERLWKEIFSACRVELGKTEENWKQHTKDIQRHVEMLNAYNFKSLHYTNSIGTDVTVELPQGHFWAGGAEKAKSGVMFSPNVPTEEVFTLPKKNGVNGVLVASKPLCHNGVIIDGFRFRVVDGKITEVHAQKGEEVLKGAVAVDEGASYFGECALVPFDSPISASGVLFLNTLFDENASCHFAFGSAYPCIYGAEQMSEKELEERGMNNSLTHVDFMIGTSDLKIVGTTYNGKEVTVFENGNFAF